MKKQLLFASLVFFLLFGALSCKDKDNKKSYCTENPGSCQSVLAAKEFFLFKEGSWWVYEEETSHERDSVYVYQSVNNINNYDFDVKTHSVLQDYDYHYWPTYTSPNGCSASQPVNKKCIFINRSKGKANDYVGQDYCFFINTVKGAYETVTGNIFYDNNKISVSDIYQNYTIGELNFSRTVKIHELSTRIEGIQPTNHYFSKDVGLIRKELLDSNQVWNLVSYHIEP